MPMPLYLFPLFLLLLIQPLTHLQLGSGLFFEMLPLLALLLLTILWFLVDLASFGKWLIQHFSFRALGRWLGRTTLQLIGAFLLFILFVFITTLLFKAEADFRLLQRLFILSGPLLLYGAPLLLFLLMLHKHLPLWQAHQPVIVQRSAHFQILFLLSTLIMVELFSQSILGRMTTEIDQSLLTLFYSQRYHQGILIAMGIIALELLTITLYQSYQTLRHTPFWRASALFAVTIGLIALILLLMPLLPALSLILLITPIIYATFPDQPLMLSLALLTNGAAAITAISLLIVAL